MIDEFIKWATTDNLGVGITSGVTLMVIGSVGVAVKKFLFPSKPQTDPAKIHHTVEGKQATQVAGERAVMVQKPEGPSVVNTGDGANTTITGVPPEFLAQLAKQLGIKEERLNTLTRVLEDAGIPLHEAPVRIPEMMARLKTLEDQLDAAPKVGGRTDELRQKAEAALAVDDFDAADDWLRQAEEQDGQAQHQLADESQDRARAAAASAIARGDLAWTRFKYTEAASHFLRAADHYPDQDHRDRIQALNRGGLAFHEAADFSQAETAYARAQTLAETTLEQNDPLIATVLSNLAALYHATNRLDQAEPLMERALTINEKTFGPDHPNVAIDLNNLAQLYDATDRLDQAEPLMKRALSINEKAFGPDHPKVTIHLNNLAQLYDTTNRLGHAEPLMKRALRIDEKAFGQDHPTVARDLSNLAALYHATSRSGQAEPLMERALAIDEKAFGPDHPKVAIHLNNLAQLYDATNRLDQAEPLMERALGIEEYAFGPNHPNVASSLNNLAALYRDTNRLGRAEPLFERAVKILTASLGAEHPNTKDVENNLAILRAEMAQRGDGI